MKKIFLYLLVFLAVFVLFTNKAFAMPIGTLLYRTSNDGHLYGYSTDELVVIEKGLVKGLHTGHVAMYIGQENGIDYIIEATPNGIQKTEAKYFLNSGNKEEFLGAKIPKNLTELQREKIAEISKSLINSDLAYDFDFKKQKGPGSGEWTCVGLVEKIYESANISNPKNLASLEYDPEYYAIDITEDGYDNYSIYNFEKGDYFSRDKEFSKINNKRKSVIPFPELIGFNAGLEYEGDRYFFFPYTQFLQDNLEDVEVDIQIESNFYDEKVRGSVSKILLALKWSFINNPKSSFKRIVRSINNFIKGKSGIAKEEEIFVYSEDYIQEQENENIIEESNNSSVQLEKKDNQDYSILMVNLEKKNEESENIQPENIKEKVVVTENNLVDLSNIEWVEEESIIENIEEEIIEEDMNDEIVLLGEEIENEVIESIPQIVIQKKSNTAATVNSSSQENIELKKILISEVYSTGYNDYIKIFNTNDFDVDLAKRGYRLEKTKTGDDPDILLRFSEVNDVSYPGFSIIKANDYFKIVRDDADEETKKDADAIALRDEFTWTKSGYTIYLADDPVSNDNDEDIIDKVGFGNAEYYEGAYPAEEILDNYILKRKAIETSTEESMAKEGDDSNLFSCFDSDDNRNDFVLVSDGNIIEEETNEEIAGEVNDVVITSKEVSNIWHFDECLGASLSDSTNNSENILFNEEWVVGKFGCGIKQFYEFDDLEVKIDNHVNINNSSLGFWYNFMFDNSRLYIKLANLEKEFKITIFSHYTEIFSSSGGSQRIDNLTWPIDGWHLFNIVISDNEDLFTLYLDGQKVYTGSLDINLSDLNLLNVGSDNNYTLLDELTVWNYPLNENEIDQLFKSNIQLEPKTTREKQYLAKKNNYWSFDEINGDDFSIEHSNLIENCYNNGCIQFSDELNIEKYLSNSIMPRDLTLDFWWKNSSSPNEGRMNLRLMDINDQDIFSLTPTYIKPEYFFNGERYTISNDIGAVIPNDDLWHHLILSYDSYEYMLRFYVDSELVLEKEHVWLNNDIKKVRIENPNWSFQLDELIIWDGKLNI